MRFIIIAKNYAKMPGIGWYFGVFISTALRRSDPHIFTKEIV